MPARIIQWQPVEAFDELWLIPRRDAREAFAARAKELRAIELVTRDAQLYAPGVNIDGGWISVGEPLLVGRMVDVSVDQLAYATAELADVLEPTRFLVRDPDGVRAVHAPHLLEDIAVLDVVDWRAHLAREGQHALLVASVTEAMAVRGASVDELPELEALLPLAPDEPELLRLLAQLYLALARHADAERCAQALIATSAPAYRKAPAHSVLGEVASARGAFADALVHHRAAYQARPSPERQLAIGIAAMRADDVATAWQNIAPAGRARTLLETAEAMCELGRIADAHALLELALEVDRSILAPVPANQWPKPPDTTWTAAHPPLAALVAGARAGVADG